MFQIMHTLTVSELPAEYLVSSQKLASAAGPKALYRAPYTDTVLFDMTQLKRDHLEAAAPPAP